MKQIIYLNLILNKISWDKETKCLTEIFLCTLGSGEIVKDKLGEISKAAVLSNLTTIVQGLKTIRTDLDNMDSLTKSLQKNARALEIGRL